MNRKVSVKSLHFIVMFFSLSFTLAVTSCSSQYFLDQKKRVPPYKEWAREVVSTGGGTFHFRVSSQGPVSITLVTDEGYKAIMARDMSKFSKHALLLTVDSQDNVYESQATQQFPLLTYPTENTI